MELMGVWPAFCHPQSISICTESELREAVHGVIRSYPGDRQATHAAL
jgi:hypothetical protein